MITEKGTINSLPNTEEATPKSRILVVIGKIFKIVILGYFYFFITVMSTMVGDSCGVEDCKILGIVLMVGVLWMLISFIVTVLSIIQNKKIISFIPNTIFMPYLAIPIFMGIIALASTLKGV